MLKANELPHLFVFRGTIPETSQSQTTENYDETVEAQKYPKELLRIFKFTQKGF